MKLSNKAYDKMKWILTLVVPAGVTLLTTIGTIYGYDFSIVTNTITAVATFVGAIFVISSNKYDKEG